MYKRILRALPATLASIFSLLAFIFGVLAISSREWAVRNAYARLANPWQWNQTVFTIYRSPFVLCNAVANSTIATEPIGWNVTCQNFRPYGFNRTSCELGIATQSDGVPQYGDQRLCQQIHYAGNLGITSVVFITFGTFLICLLGITSLSIVFSRSSNVEERRTPHDEGSSDATVPSSPPLKPQRRRHRFHRSTLASYINFCGIYSLFIGAIAALICQFYAIEGLIQSAPNNSDFASTSASSNDDINIYGNHGPWYQGKALSAYITCAWTFAVAAGVVAARVWTLPTWKIGL